VKNKAWGKGTVLVRWTLNLAVLYGVWIETGLWTTMLLAYISFSVEGLAWIDYKRHKRLTWAEELQNFPLRKSDDYL